MLIVLLLVVLPPLLTLLQGRAAARTATSTDDWTMSASPTGAVDCTIGAIAGAEAGTAAVSALARSMDHHHKHQCIGIYSSSYHVRSATRTVRTGSHTKKLY